MGEIKTAGSIISFLGDLSLNPDILCVVIGHLRLVKSNLIFKNLFGQLDIIKWNSSQLPKASCKILLLSSQTGIFLISFSKNCDFIWRLAIACLIGGSLSRTPSTAAKALWLNKTRLSKIRCCSLPRSTAITTAL